MITNPIKTPPAKFDTLHNGSGLASAVINLAASPDGVRAEYSREDSPLYHYDRWFYIILNTLNNNNIHLSPSV